MHKDTNKLLLCKNIVTYFKLIPTKGFCLELVVYFASECLLIQSHKATLQAKLQSIPGIGLQHRIQRLCFLRNVAVPKACGNFTMVKSYLFVFLHFLHCRAAHWIFQGQARALQPPPGPVQRIHPVIWHSQNCAESTQENSPQDHRYSQDCYLMPQTPPLKPSKMTNQWWHSSLYSYRINI